MKIAQAFEPYEMPENALPVRCHVLKDEQAQALEDFLVTMLPECFTTTAALKSRKEETGLCLSELLANKMPDKGSVMSGDFGEVLTLFFLGSERDEKTNLIKKWRYKQDRSKAAPHSDVIIFHRKSTKTASEKDFVICAESKQKSTESPFQPILKAIEGYESDKIGRLARTLVWLREKAIDQESEQAIDYLNRFTVDPTTKYSKYYKAVAIIDRDLLNDEITKTISLPEQNDEFEVVVLGLKDLKNLYETCFSRAVEEIDVE
jgi:hypothetical protein